MTEDTIFGDQITTGDGKKWGQVVTMGEAVFYSFIMDKFK
jgi:hypothetical protein